MISPQEMPEPFDEAQFDPPEMVSVPEAHLEHSTTQPSHQPPFSDCLPDGPPTLPKKINRVVMEVGSGGGSTVLRWLPHLDVAHGARLIAFEPDPGCPLHRCTHPGLHFYPMALGAAPDTLWLRRYRSINQSHLLPDETSPHNPPSSPGKDFIDDVTVSIYTIDDIFDDQVLPRLSLLRLDCNGFEPFVLWGAQQTINRLTPTILLRLDPDALARYGADTMRSLAILLSMGYEVLPVGEENDNWWLAHHVTKAPDQFPHPTNTFIL